MKLHFEPRNVRAHGFARTALSALMLAALLFGNAEAATENEEAANPFVQLEKQTEARIGVAAIDASSKREVMHRAEERFAMCSTFKVLAAAAVLQRVDQNKEQLDRFVRYGEAQLLTYAPVTREHLNEGGMTLDAICAAAIGLSDNTAGNLLLDAIGSPKGLTKFARSLDDRATRLDRTEPTLNVVTPSDERDTTTPAAMCRDLQRLFTSQILSPKSQTRLEDWMKASQTGMRMIRAGLPAGWSAGDKTGRSGTGTTNDIAILRPPAGGPIFIAIYLVGGGDSTEARDAVVAEATKIALAQLSRISPK